MPHPDISFFIAIIGLVQALALLTAAAWWGISLWQAWGRVSREALAVAESSDEVAEVEGGSVTCDIRLSVFKPIPDRRGEAPSAHTLKALSSFIEQLRECDEVLLCMSEADENAWGEVLRRWQQNERCFVRVLRRPGRSVGGGGDESPDALANPKAQCLRHMSRLAQGEFWIWSDADVIAPPGLVNAALHALSRGEVSPGAVTIPYRVTRTSRAPGVLDVLYVNAELLPGLRLMALAQDAKESKAGGGVAFALGAFTAFRAARFHEKADWNRIGGSLADDFELGQALQPVVVSDTQLVEIAAEEPDWWSAILHYHRWQKNIRWCQPGGFAAQIFITPVAVGIVSAVLPAALEHRDSPALLSCAILLTQITLLESAWAILLCRAVNCRLGWLAALAPIWSVARALTWLAVWLPLPVKWGNRWWAGPRWPLAISG